MLGRRVAGGCSAFPDVHKGLILHATPFLDDETRKQGNIRWQKWVDFVKQRRAKGAYTNSSICLRHFIQDDDIRHFSFDEEVANKAFMSRLTRDEIEITAVPSVHDEAVTKTLVVIESAKHCLERAIRMRESVKFSNFLIYLYCESKASEIFIRI